MSHGHSHNGEECHGHGGGVGSSDDAKAMNSISLKQAINLQQLSRQLGDMSTDESSKSFAFWNTQPVPKMDEFVDETVNSFIEPNVSLDKIRQEPYSLPDAFAWSDVDLNDEQELKELYTLLTENYVEDEDNMFRFDYSAEFLKWALQIPGWLKQWHCGVRAKQSGKLLAFIGAVPQKISVYKKDVQMVEINFLCVHKKLRSKRVTPVLIREITRRVNQQGIFQAAYTAGIVIPKPVAICRYWHRSLNPKKLIEVKFSHLSAKMTLARTIKLFKLPEEPTTQGLRPMTKKDVPSAFKLLSNYLTKFDLAPKFSIEEFEYLLTPRDGVCYTFVVEKNGVVTDLISFYSLPSTVMHHPVHKTIRAAYSYYNVAGTVTFKQLMNDALILARKNDFDVFNALNLMDNQDILEELKFGIGDGNLQYYLYNWKCSGMLPHQVGLVLQ
ncbi:unnamed protein product [Auanema sp. JU1783]|nr:unnamed protein product [Auanema sp. JU1783]